MSSAGDDHENEHQCLIMQFTALVIAHNPQLLELRNITYTTEI